MILLAVVLLLLSSPPSTCSAATRKPYQNYASLPTQGASLAWTYHPHNATLDLSFSSSFISPSGWVAWGLNPDSPQMTGSRSLIAFPDPATGSLLLLPFILSPSVKLQGSPLRSAPLDVPILASSAALTTQQNRISASADIEIRISLKLSPNRTFIHIVWNRGVYVQGYSPTIHPTTASDLASFATIDLLSSSSSTLGSRRKIPGWLKPAHGIVNAVSWGFCIPVGAVVARYLRQFSGIGPAWFYAHSAVQVTGFVLGAVGFTMGVFMGSASPGVVYGLHRGLGTAAVVMGGLQAAALVLRPRATGRYRKYWKSYHHLVGYGCVVVGVVNVFEGMEVMGIGRSYAKLAYCVVLAALMGGCLALEVNAWVIFCRKAEEEKVMKREEVVAKGRRSNL